MTPDKIAIVATAIKILIDAIKAAFPGLQGRWTQLVVLVLATGGGVWLVGWADPLNLLAFIGSVWAAALGIDQVLKKTP